ncbi:MAG: hypothetical protein ACJ77N_12200 [Chloroflexota bacterium]
MLPRTDADNAVLALVDAVVDDRARHRFVATFVQEGILREARPDDHVWRTLATAIAAGSTIPALPRLRPSGTPLAPDAGLVCRPASGLAAIAPRGAADVEAATERGLTAEGAKGDTRFAPPIESVVLDERLVLKAYRVVQPGLSAELEMTAYLSEEAGFTAVPKLAGWAEVVARDEQVTTIALLEEFVADAVTADIAIGDQLADWIRAPGEVSVEWATEIADPLGALVADLHVALVSPPADAVDFVPRPATRDELRSWRRAAHRDLDDAVTRLRGVDHAAAGALSATAPDLAARLTLFDALASVPVVSRVHGDLRLSNVLFAPDGARIVGFDGDRAEPIAARRAYASPLRDVAAILVSLTEVARSASRRAMAASPEASAGIAHVGIDVDEWLARSRERFLAAYRRGVREAGAPFDVDGDLVAAFEAAETVRQIVRSLRAGRIPLVDQAHSS